MSAISRLRVWLRRAWRRDELDRDMQDEMQLHVDLFEADLRQSGVAPEEARRRARAAFGSIDAKKDEVRTVLGLRLLDELRTDVGYALRLLRRSPGFTSVALLSLSLGIGANTAIFNLIDTVLLKELPVEEPATLFFIDNSGGKSAGDSGPPYPCFELLRDRNTTLAGIAAFDAAPFKVTIDGVAEEVPGQYASGSLFDVLGIRPHYGRLITPSDDAVIGQGGMNGGVAVISHRLWTRRFRSDPAILGRAITVGTRDVTIVGVLPPEYFGLQVGSRVDVVVPMTLAETNLRARSLWWFSVVGRVKAGVPVEHARAELHALWDGYMNDIGQPREKRGYFSGIELLPAARGLARMRRQLTEPLLITMTIVGLVLLIGCANVANLLLARVSVRRTELAVRLAIGASRGRLMRQLLTEGVVLSLCGAVAGLAVASWGVSFLVATLARADNGRVLEPAFDARVFGFAVAAAIVSAALFSLAPAWHVLNADAARSPSIGAREQRRQGRLGQTLVLVQVVLSIALLSGSVMFLRTLQNLHSVSTGFDAQGVVAVPVATQLPRPAIVKPSAAEIRAYHAQLSAAWRRMIDPVRALPGVAMASVATMTPFTGRDRGVLIAVPGAASLSEADRYLHINHVTDEYFDALGIPLIDGRLFAPSDRTGAPRVAILNQTAAMKYFPGQHPIGRAVSFPGQRIEEAYEVVGIVADVRYVSAREADERMAYIPLEQSLDAIREAVVVARGSNGVPPAIGPLRDTAAGLMPGGFAPRAEPLGELVDASLTRERLLSILATFFGLLALLLACVGLYGVMTYGVVRRTREIGIRLAIGASQWSVTQLILRDTMMVVVVGVGLGAMLSIMVGRLITGMLFEVEVGDPIAMGVASVLLVAVAAVASYLPARRAMRIDPALTLRSE